MDYLCRSRLNVSKIEYKAEPFYINTFSFLIEHGIQLNRLCSECLSALAVAMLSVCNPLVNKVDLCDC